MDIDQFGNDDNSALYIEELRSDDPNLKINAVTKVASIAKILEEKDNEDEFLVKLTEEIAKISVILGTEDSAQLLGPLEIMASMEEPTIREKAVETLKIISKDQTQQFFSNYFINMIKRLASWDNYPSRVSACSLFYICYPHLSSNDRAEIRQLYGELARDDTPMVRRAAASNIKNLVNVFEEENVKADLLPLFSVLIKDDTDSVKINSLESSIHLLSYYTRKEVRENLILLLKNLDPENKSWRVRYALAENLIHFCSKIDKEVILGEIYPIYEAMLKDSEQEVRSCAVMKLPDLCNYLSDSIIQNKIVLNLTQLATDSSLHVRLSLAQTICKIPIRNDPNFFGKSMLPIFQTLFKDEVTEVRIALIQNISFLASVLDKQQVKSHLLPLLFAITNDKQWRSKLTLLEILPQLCKDLGYEMFKDEFLGLIKGFCLDHVQAIRNQAIEDLCQLHATFGPDRMNEIVENVFDELLKSSNYIYRVTALHAVPKLSKQLSKSQMYSILDKAISILGADKVPNVRFNLVKMLEGATDILKEKQGLWNSTKQLLGTLKTDEDADVSYFAKAALDKSFQL